MIVNFSLTTKGIVTLVGEADLGSPLTQEGLEMNLGEIVQRAMSNGLVTGDSSATLDEYSVYTAVEEVGDDGEKVDFTLTVKGAVNLNGEENLAPLSQEELEMNLGQIIQRAMSEGLVTGDSSSTVDEYSVYVTIEDNDAGEEE